MNIPFVDLKAQYQSIKQPINEAIQNVLENTAFIGGKHVKSFETNFAQYIDIKHCISCANGTDSIEILLQALEVQPGDEVIVPAISWISTSEAVSAIGAKPVFVDLEPDYFTIDPTKIEEKITGKTKAIIPVHLYGQPADMPAIIAIAEKHNLKVLEDCAQAHGAMIAGKKIGTWGDAASFSFYPGKNLGAYGDAGCMITNNDEVAQTARMIANHGQISKHNHQIEGRNSRLDSLHAAVLNVKLPYVEPWTNLRIQHATVYNQLLQKSALRTPPTRENARHVFHLFVVRTNKRDELKQYLQEKGISTQIHYPTALPFLDCYKHYNHTMADFPVASTYQSEILSLPMYPELTGEMLNYVAEQTLIFLENE